MARCRWGVLLGAFALLVTGGCSVSEPDVLRFGLASAPATLDPRYATDAASTRITRLLFERLVDFDDRFRAVPSMARWTRENPLQWRFELVGEHRFGDGRRVTADDVRATYQSVLDPATGSPHRGSLANIARVEALDARRVRFSLHQPDPLFPGRLVVGVLPAAAVAAGRRFDPVDVTGSGPFELLRYDGDGRVRLRRRGDGQRFEFLRVANPTVRVLKLLRGEIDMLQGDLPPELVAWLARRDGVRVERHRGNNFAYIGFNMDDAVAGRKEVRQAIALAIDREAIIHYVFDGNARIAAAVLPPEHWAGDPDLHSAAHDPRRARALLAAAGLTGARHPRLTYKTSSDPLRLRLATVIQAQLAEVGIEVRVRSYDWGTFYGDIKSGRFQMFSLAWVGIKLPDIFRYTMHSASVPPEGANRGRYRSARADRLIERAESASELSEQARVFRELQHHLLADLPYVPLWYEDQVFVAGARARGFEVTADGSYDGLSQVRRVGGG